jgi:ubiquinone/menaquinone biosynthesis C-methylase UbiE
VKVDPEEIKDTCRKGLLKYLIKAVSVITPVEKPLILDMGCGSGVPAVALSDIYNGIIYAVDSNKIVLSRLEEKIKQLHLSDRIITINSSVLDMPFPEIKFDIVIAEGVLHAIGYENGLSFIYRNIKENGYAVIHDEYSNHAEITKIIKRNNYALIESFKLDEKVWWNDYYNCLEKKISSYHDRNSSVLFKSELQEIELFKRNPARFRSRYYILKRQ